MAEDLVSLWDAAKPAPPAQPQPQSLEDAWASAKPADQGNEDDARIKSIFDAAITKAPDRHAAVLQLAQQTGAHPQLVESQFDLFKAKAQESQLDPRRFRLENPGLADFILQRPTSPLSSGTNSTSSGASSGS